MIYSKGQNFTKTIQVELKLKPIQLFELLHDNLHSVFLDSALDKSKLGRFSVIAYNPFQLFEAIKNKVTITNNHGNIIEYNENPLDVLKRLLSVYTIKKNTRQDNVPFTPGCIGFFSYDLCSSIEEFEDIALDDMGIPHISLGFYDSTYTYDHINKVWYLSACIFGVEGCIGEQQNQEAENILNQRLLDMQQIMNCALERSVVDEASSTSTKNVSKTDKTPKSSYTVESYCKMVERAKEYIRNGDIFQVNISQRFETEIEKPPFEIYKHLRIANAAPFSAYINLGDVKVLSSSPERFFTVRDGQVQTRPIKGTRPRGVTPDEDELLKAELLSSEKDRAELTMITDLMRNDLGRVSKIGSVKVDKLFELEQYATVHHLVSTVSSTLKEGGTAVDVIAAAFPGGSITGAPKIRAMQIIEELEPVKRNVYTGSIGYISFDGNCDLNIAIRTIVVKGNRAVYNVGGGIVWDSVPISEYHETLHKGRALMRVLGNEQ